MKEAAWKPQLPPFRKYKKTVFANVIKTSSFIYQIGESPALRETSKAVPVGKITSPEYKKKLAYLKSCMKKYRRLAGMGRGITAVQVGISERFSVIYMPEIKGELSIIVNPEITKRSKKLLVYPEMCMSANPIIASVVRPSWIEFSYYDEEGKKKYWDRKDTTRLGKMYNRVFLHEIDHMDGMINIDKVDAKSLIFESDPSFYENATFEEV